MPGTVPVAALLLGVVLGGCAGPQSMLDPAGPAARETAALWWGMFAVAGVVLAGVTGLWLRAQRRAAPAGDASADGLRWIVLGGLLLPGACIAVLLFFGVPAGERIARPGGEAAPLRVEVTARQWQWDIRYPQGGVELRNALHLPVGRVVELQVRSVDVIHSFWVPRLGGKIDAVPGRTNVIRLLADRPGAFRGQCAEFCGRDHAFMTLWVHAHEGRAFDEWLRESGR